MNNRNFATVIETIAFVKMEPNMISMKVSDPDVSFWWTKTGLLLANMMDQANYPPEIQERYLGFYFHCIIPVLGPRPDATNLKSIWPSFMTDDHTPLEFSWAWANQKSNPEVRFSVEPVQYVTSPRSSHFGETAIRHLASHVRPFCGKFDLDLFEVLARNLVVKDQSWATPESLEDEGHINHYFAAFNLSPSGITFKVYIVPAQMLLQDGTQTWGQVCASVGEISKHNAAMSSALAKLNTFFQTCSTKYGLKVVLVSSDCLPVSEARIKIYFRTQASSFQSIMYFMTLGGTLIHGHTETAMTKLKELWNLVLGRKIVCAEDETQDLPPFQHLTAGFIYYFSIQPGSREPRPKVYIPVRHYAESDFQVAKGLEKYFGCSSKRRYSEMIRSVFPRSALENELGLHTYIAVEFKGEDLVVTSYINPKVYSEFKRD